MSFSTKTLAAATAVVMAVGCGEDGSSTGGEVPDPGNTGLSQPGAQDFGLFRQILEAGGIPGPGALDDLGFFAEHKLDYPEPDCGDDVCLHGLYGAMGNMIDGSTCTLLQLGMNTPIDPETLERPPMHLVVALDVSGSMVGPPLEFVKAGLKEMVLELHPEDTLSLVTYSDEARLVLDSVPMTETASIVSTIETLGANGATNLYDGLFTALIAADANFLMGQQNRVIFLSDGLATTGVPDAAKLTNLARSYAERGIQITTIGVGTEFDVDVMRDLAEVGAGNFYFLEDPKAVKEVFVDEVHTFLFPIALDVQIAVDVDSAYEIRGVYGTKQYNPASDSSGYVEIPSLFLAGRETADEPIEEGRRGGGGAILIELVPRLDAPPPADDVAELVLRYEDADTGEVITRTVQVASAGAPPAEGYFDDATVEKGFVMLNLFAGFELATQFAADSDLFMARRTLESLRPNVAAWLESKAEPDPDIVDDLRYVDMFLVNIEAAWDSTIIYEPTDSAEPLAGRLTRRLVRESNPSRSGDNGVATQSRHEASGDGRTDGTGRRA